MSLKIQLTPKFAFNIPLIYPVEPDTVTAGEHRLALTPSQLQALILERILSPHLCAFPVQDDQNVVIDIRVLVDSQLKPQILTCTFSFPSSLGLHTYKSLSMHTPSKEVLAEQLIEQLQCFLVQLYTLALFESWACGHGVPILLYAHNEYSSLGVDACVLGDGLCSVEWGYTGSMYLTFLQEEEAPRIPISYASLIAKEPNLAELYQHLHRIEEIHRAQQLWGLSCFLAKEETPPPPHLCLIDLPFSTLLFRSFFSVRFRSYRLCGSSPIPQ